MLEKESRKQKRLQSIESRRSQETSQQTEDDRLSENEFRAEQCDD